MSDESSQSGGAPTPPTEEEIRAAMEEEVRKLRVPDLLLQTAASVLNLSARRIGKEDERDLDQARTGIDAVKAMIPFLDEEPGRQVQQAVSELQMAYARVSQGGEFAPETQPEEKPDGDSGLWVPPGA